MDVEKLRIGEEKRDASTKIRGYLYQDLVSLKILMESSRDANIYCEWVEDIYVEDNSKIRIIQVKYYTASTINFNTIYTDMYYQYLKTKLFEVQKKVILECLYYGKSTFNEQDCYEKLAKTSTTKSLSKEEIASTIDELKNCKNIHDSKNFLFSKLNSIPNLDEFKFQASPLDNITELREKIKVIIYDEFKNIGIISKIDSSQAKEILLSTLISYLQEKYYSSSNVSTDRVINKLSVTSYLENLYGQENDYAYVELIISVLGEVIDRVYLEIYDTVSDPATISEYKKISMSTKNFFKTYFITKENRFKFINTISMESNKILNLEYYLALLPSNEFLIFVENKKLINIFIRTLWKIQFSHDSVLDIKDILIDNHDFIEFNLSSKSSKSEIVMLSSELSSIPRSEYKYLLERMRNFKNRPTKLFLHNCLRGTHYYDYNIYNMHQDINDISKLNLDSMFTVECMKCVKCDLMEIKDDIEVSIFSDKCVEDNK